MSTMPGAEPLTDDELDRLQAFFLRQASEDAFDIEELDGYFAALVVGPELVMPREYLPAVLGSGGDDESEDAEDVFASLDEANELVGLMMRHWNTIVAAVESEEIYLPLILERESDDEGARPEGHRWARGFMRGVHLRRESWSVLINDEEHGGAILPMALLAGEVDEHFLDRPMDPERNLELLNHLAAGLHAIRLYFEPIRLANAALLDEESDEARTVRRGMPKVGRNDPCPCGSGKKFKQCCSGAGGAVH